MHKVLIKTNLFDKHELKLFKTLIECFYQTNCNVADLELNTLDYVLVVRTSASLGKEPIIRFLKQMKLEYCIFIKNDVMYKKWLDTGIVDKMGECDVQFNVYRLKGV